MAPFPDPPTFFKGDTGPKDAGANMQSDFNLDTDLLGLQHELLAFLADRGIVWFVDFTRVEADLGNGELKIYLTCPYERVARAVRQFAEENGFPRVFYSAEKGAVYLRRR